MRYSLNYYLFANDINSFCSKEHKTSCHEHGHVIIAVPEINRRRDS